MRAKSDRTRRINIFMTEEMHKELKVYAAQHDTDMTHFVLSAINEKLDREVRPNKEVR